jgi:hypothetical protein
MRGTMIEKEVQIYATNLVKPSPKTQNIIHHSQNPLENSSCLGLVYLL